VQHGTLYLSVVAFLYQSSTSVGTFVTQSSNDCGCTATCSSHLLSHKASCDAIPAVHVTLVLLAIVCCVMLCRPDVLPPPVLQELSKLQDRIEPFSTTGKRKRRRLC
jgi:hypothetical protein